ncbi:MAG TPA: hypothetical protein VL404_05150 [Candidatus Eisenbacteria bacterium]|nr:hypothetical protein [Candidatus Eisenbacteria bacterium]
MRSLDRRYWGVPLVVLVLYLAQALSPAYVNPYYKNSYNLVVDAWLAGQLHLKPALDAAFLKSPYNFVAHLDYILAQGIIDLSVYRDRLYSYFGAAPAAVLYLPFRVLTFGRQLPDKAAVLIFCAGGFLAASALLLHVRRRHFPGAPEGAVHLSLAVLGLANMAPMLIRLSNVYEVAMSAAYCFFMTSLYWLVSAFGDEGVSRPRLFAAGLCAGLAAGSRPTFALAALACLSLTGWRLRRREGPRAAASAAAFALPLAAVLSAIAAYNWRRFGNPFEFGARYQITPLNPMGMGLLLDPSRILLSAYLFLFQAPVAGGQPYLRVSHESYGLFRWPASTYQIDGGALGMIPGVPFVLLFLFGPMLVWVSRSAGASEYLGPRSPFRAALRDTFLLYLGLILLGRFLAPFRGAAPLSEAALFVDRCNDELPLGLAFATILTARFFSAAVAGEPAAPAYPRFEASLLGASFLALFGITCLHQNVNLRYPADFISLAVLSSAILWFHCDARLRARPGGETGLRALLGGMTFVLAGVSVYVGLLFSR